MAEENPMLIYNSRNSKDLIVYRMKDITVGNLQQ